MEKVKKILSIFLSGLILANFLNLNISTYAASGLDDEIDVRVSTMSELKEALSNDSISTIAVTDSISLDGNNLDGKGKTIRTEKLGMNDSGLATGGGSSYSVFYNNSGFTSSAVNMTIRGGGTTALKNYGTLTLDNVTIRDVYTKHDHGGAIYNSGHLFVKNSFLTRNLADAGGGFFTNGSSSLMIMDNSTRSENYSIAGGVGAGEISGSSTLYASNTTFSNNQSKEYGGALNLYYSKMAQIQNCTFTGNSTNRSLKYGPAVGVRGDSSTVFKATNSLFAYNYTGNGGK